MQEGSVKQMKQNSKSIIHISFLTVYEKMYTILDQFMPKNILIINCYVNIIMFYTILCGCVADTRLQALP